MRTLRVVERRHAAADDLRELTLKPAEKILPKIRGWFPDARIIGWKFELDGPRDQAITRAQAQIREAHRRLMRSAHPDHGGSDWLATRINQARDVLLG